MTFHPISGTCSVSRKAKHFSQERISILGSALAVPFNRGKAGAGHPQAPCAPPVRGWFWLLSPHPLSLSGSAAFHPTDNFSG